MTEKKRIAFLCHPYHRGGVTRWMADAAIAAAAGGHEVYFITVEPEKEFFSARGRETMLQLLGNDNRVTVIKTRVGMEFEFGTPQYRTYVYRKLIVQLPLCTPIILSDDSAVWAAATSLHASYFITGVLHSDENHYYDNAQKYAEHIDALVCVSNRVSKTTQSRIPGFDPGRIYTIPCGINLPGITDPAGSGNILRLVYVGRVSDYQKRTGDLLKIGSLLSQKKIQFHMDIIGDGNKKKELEQETKESGLQENVTFWGWRSQKEVAMHLSGSDILVLTSDFEGTPVSMMEALASGCGFTGTRVSGIEDYEFHPLAADCFAVYTTGDIEDAVNKIMKVAAVPKDTRRQAARKLAESAFSMEVCLEKYFKVMEQVKPCTQPPVIKMSFTDILYSRLLATARYMKVRLVNR